MTLAVDTHLPYTSIRVAVLALDLKLLSLSKWVVHKTVNFLIYINIWIAITLILTWYMLTKKQTSTVPFWIKRNKRHALRRTQHVANKILFPLIRRQVQIKKLITRHTFIVLCCDKLQFTRDNYMSKCSYIINRFCAE